MNKEILDKVQEIVDFIKETKEYKNYEQSKKLLEQDTYLNKLINDIKDYQKRIVRNPSKKEELECKIQETLEELNNSPLYTEYNYYLEEVNNMLIIFENKINKYFEDVFN